MQVSALLVATFRDLQLLEEALVELAADGWRGFVIGVGTVTGYGQCSSELTFKIT
jgi:hypothetical protein